MCFCLSRGCNSRCCFDLDDTFIHIELLSACCFLCSLGSSTHLFILEHSLHISHYLFCRERVSGARSWGLLAWCKFLELLELLLLLIFELGNLFNNGLEDLVGRHVIELSEGCVYSLGVLEGNILGAVASEDTFRLSSEDDLFDTLDITVTFLLSSSLILTAFFPSGLSSELKLIVHYGLFLIPLAPVVSALHEFLHKPLNDWEYLSIIETLDLLWG